MINRNVSNIDERSIWTVPALVYLGDKDHVDIVVNSWDSKTVIKYPIHTLPDGIVEALKSESSVVVEARVDLGSDDANHVVVQVVKMVEVPDDSKMGF